MGSARIEERLSRHLHALYCLAAVLLIAVVLLYPPTVGDVPTLAILVPMALLAESMPVRLNRDGLRITLSLPFVAGIAISNGPAVALAADLVITALAAIGLGLLRRERVSLKWLGVNLGVAASAAGAAGLAMYAFVGLDPVSFGLARDLAFVLVYCVVNFLLVTHLNSLVSARRFSENVLNGLRVGTVGLALYCLVAGAVAVLIAEGQIAWLPVMAIPVLALRAGLSMKARIYEHYFETVAALSQMLQRSTPVTHRHLERVAHLAEDVAIRLGIPPARARMVRVAALLHDIGKIAIDETILEKPAKLTEEEMAHVRLHSEYGARILSQCDQFRTLVPWVRAHHERPDGLGYPNRLQDVEIPIESKIIAVSDAYDAMVGGGEEERTYRTPMTIDEAVAELRRCAGTQFDPAVVEAFALVVRLGGAPA
ncbi:MAG TPA: HD domain-containing protein [Fimbriimonadaceae bacterium]|mgnify:CR=1 FL=1|nr:HD domain-containing protein [Fimbriimonadaceae bacterium]HRJ97506.1 HD domain-containing protein [Fimbriimonadaceae bacterium]